MPNLLLRNCDLLVGSDYTLPICTYIMLCTYILGGGGGNGGQREGRAEAASGRAGQSVGGAAPRGGRQDRSTGEDQGGIATRVITCTLGGGHNFHEKQGCGSAFFFCGSGSSCSSYADSDPARSGSRSSFKNGVQITLTRVFCR